MFIFRFILFHIGGGSENTCNSDEVLYIFPLVRPNLEHYMLGEAVLGACVFLLLC